MNQTILASLKKAALLLAFFTITFTSIAQITQQEVNTRLQNLPFPSFSIKVPSFPDKTYLITDFGAVGNGSTICTKAINSAITKCSAEGGGVVIIPAGLFITGRIEMKSNVNLHLEAGAMIVFSSDINDYLSDKKAMAPLINGSNMENVAITGYGSFDGNGQYWRPVKKEKTTERQWKDLLAKGGTTNNQGTIWYPDPATTKGQTTLSGNKKNDTTNNSSVKVKISSRPKMLSLSNSKSVLIEGITLKNSPEFAMLMRNIDGMVLKNVTVMNEWWAQNGDGLDISACKNVLFDNCTVNAGDDGICMKSSNGKSGAFNLENIVIKDCKVYHAHGGFVIGSNTDGSMHNIYVNNCNFTWTDTGLRFKSNIGRGGIVDNIFIDGVYMKDIDGEAIIFDFKYEDTAVGKNSDPNKDSGKVPDFKNFSIKNIVCDGAKTAFLVDGNHAPMVNNVTVENAVFKTDKGVIATLAQGITFINTTFDVMKKPVVTTYQTGGLTFKNCNFSQTKGTVIQLSGVVTTNISIINSNINPQQIGYTEGATKNGVTIKN